MSWLSTRARSAFRRRTALLIVSTVAIVLAIARPVPSGAAGLSIKKFTWTGVAQTFKVPAGVTSIGVDAFGGEGRRKQLTRGK